MDSKKNSMVPMLVFIGLLILTLPIFYLLMSRVLLPLLWNEPAEQDSVIEDSSYSAPQHIHSVAIVTRAFSLNDIRA